VRNAEPADPAIQDNPLLPSHRRMRTLTGPDPRRALWASGHVNRTASRTHGCTGKGCDVKEGRCQPGASTHGTFETCRLIPRMSAIGKTENDRRPIRVTRVSDRDCSDRGTVPVAYLAWLSRNARANARVFAREAASWLCGQPA
jgi:hypothetical protein